MKIVHVVEPLAGGIVSFMMSLVKNMPADSHLIVHGRRELAMPLADVKRQFHFPNVKFLLWRSAGRPLKFRKDILAFIELFVILKRLKKGGYMDVIHLHCSKAGFLGRVVARLLGMHSLVVYTPNGAPFLIGESKVSNLFYTVLEKMANCFGGRVVCCSRSEQRAYNNIGIRASLINNGIEKHEPVSRTTDRRYRRFRIVTTGRIVNQKNPSLFNEIARWFLEFKEFDFIWIGEGHQRNLLKSDNIFVTGWLSKEKVNEYVSSADLYMSTALYEGLPFAVLEALALKKTVLLSDCVGNRDLISNGLNGDTFRSPAEAIQKISRYYNNSSMLSVMGEHSMQHCEKYFDLSHTSSRYRKLYQSTAFQVMSN